MKRSPSDKPASTEFHARELSLPAELAGQRLDQALARLMPEHSRTRIKEWIDSGRIRVNGREARPRDVVAGGEAVAVQEPLGASGEGTVIAQAIDLKVVHADDWLIVVDKPAGLVVHPGAGNRDSTLQNALLHYDPSLAGLPRAGIVHRIDKDTSGLLVVARTLEAHTALVRQLQAREIERHYLAVCSGAMTAGGTIDRPIGRHPTDRVRMAVRDGGREAVTHYRVVERFHAHTYVRVKLETGRTHQIRVHMAYIKHPLVGDKVYGGRLLLPKGAGPAVVEALRTFPRQALHAESLKLEHPGSGEEMAWQSPVPADMKKLLKVLSADRA